jgi:hypothetical protein
MTPMSEQIKVGTKIRNNLGPLTFWSASCQEKKPKKYPSSVKRNPDYLLTERGRGKETLKFLILLHKIWMSPEVPLSSG